jgi:hypothetical protein
MEIHRIWNVKTKMIPVIIGATGTISKSIRQYLNNTAGKREFMELKKDLRNNITCSTNCKYRTAATPYSLETLFV